MFGPVPPYTIGPDDMTLTQTQRMATLAAAIFVFDHLTKLAVLALLGFAEEKVVVPGFFKFVHWGNTGAAWSMMHGHNNLLAVISLAALVALFIFRRHFGSDTAHGQVALGLLFGGILGNVADRLGLYHVTAPLAGIEIQLPDVRHVIDFLYFYVQRRGGGEVGFPAFNVADSAICVGVGLLLLHSWRQERARTDDQAGPAAQGRE